MIIWRLTELQSQGGGFRKFEVLVLMEVSGCIIDPTEIFNHAISLQILAISPAFKCNLLDIGKPFHGSQQVRVCGETPEIRK